MTSFVETQGRRLHAVREHLGHTQAGFAEALGMPFRTYQNYERGVREISAPAMRALLVVFGVDPAWFLSGEDDEPVFVDHSQATEIQMEEFVQLSLALEARLAELRITLPRQKFFVLQVLAYRYHTDRLGMKSSELNDLIQAVS